VLLPEEEEEDPEEDPEAPEVLEEASEDEVLDEDVVSFPEDVPLSAAARTTSVGVIDPPLLLLVVQRGSGLTSHVTPAHKSS